MTEKPNRVCKWCRKRIKHCPDYMPGASDNCRGYLHENGYHYCGNVNDSDTRVGIRNQNMAEPAEPSATPQYAQFVEQPFGSGEMKLAAPQPVAVEFMEIRCTQCGACRLTTGVCSFIDCPDPTYDFRIEALDAQPVAGEGPRYAVVDGSQWWKKGTPKLEEIAWKIYLHDRKGYGNAITAQGVVSEWVEILRPFITPACQSSIKFAGERADSPMASQSRTAMTSPAIQSTPASTGEANGEPDPWKRVKQQWEHIGKLEAELKAHVAKIRNQKVEIKRLQELHVKPCDYQRGLNDACAVIKGGQNLAAISNLTQKHYEPPAPTSVPQAEPPK